MEFATDINNVMFAYIDRKKKFPVTTLLRSIGFETDKDILELFGMADEVKADKKTLSKYTGKRLAARVLKTWVEDFVDEDTGEVVSIERNEIVLERDTILDEEAISLIAEMNTTTIAKRTHARACGGETVRRHPHPPTPNIVCSCATRRPFTQRASNPLSRSVLHSALH